MSAKVKAAACLICIVMITLGGCAGSGMTDEAKPSTTVVQDYSSYFNGMKGTAVFLKEKGEYLVYNQELADMPTSPDSTFKIISCLAGLESGAIDPSASTMKWDGTKYPIAEWNRDLDFKEAFKASAIWYYRKVVDLTGQDNIQETLNKLDYGNRDISRWEGNLDNKVFPGIKDLKSINGFWQESSLEISPIQQAVIMQKIFCNNEVFSEENIELIKEVMLTDSRNENVKLYGKTGTGVRDEDWANAWFVGFFEYNGEKVCFAIRVNDPGATGKDSKEIAIDTINNEFAG